MSDQLTINQAIKKVCLTTSDVEIFKAGAEWQKEQYNRILVLAFNAANELNNRGACSLAGHIKTELERLQD
jgi:hypothetical protein